MKQETINQELKTEHKLFLEKLNNINMVDLNLMEYLRESIKSEKDKNTRCIGWDFLKTNLTKPLKLILDSFDYWKKTYNNDKVKDILSYYSIKYGEKYDLTEELLKQLGSFVYVWNDIKRKLDKKEQEQNLKIMLEREGFKEIEFIKLKKDETIEEFNKRQEKYYKQFDRLKGEFVLDVDFIGILGGFDKKVIKEGKLIYSEYNKYLMLIPKRCRTRGHIIRDKIYYKEV